jgi:hypothetical protein
MKVSFSEEIKYNTYFTDKTMRVDLYHTGNSTEDVYTLERIFKENKICSSEKNLIDYINNGRNFLKVYDERSGKLIFSHGFDSIFGEYQTTDDSIKGIKRTYSETLYMPYPKNNIIFTIERRDKYNKLNKVFEVMIDPASTNIINEKPSKEVEVIDFLINGDPREKVDILYIAEGYKKDQKQKFIDDVKRLIKVFFSYSPFREYKNSFNIRGAFLPSEDEGCDESSHGSFKSTAINCGFDFLGSERYLMTNDNYLLRKVCVNYL